RHLIRSMILNLIRRCTVISAVNRSSSRRAGKWLKRSRYAVSRNVLFEQSSSMRMPRYSRTPPWPSTSLILERAAGTPAKPGMKSCGIKKVYHGQLLARELPVSHTDQGSLRPRAGEDLTCALRLDRKMSQSVNEPPHHHPRHPGSPSRLCPHRFRLIGE